MAKDTFYFSHDYSARNDPKLVKVLMRLGQAGKGVYWDLIEMLYEQEGYLLIDEIEAYAFALRTDCDIINRLINEFDLFQKNDKNFWSVSVLNRLDRRDEKSKRASNSAKIRWDKANALKNDANALHSTYDSNAIKEMKGKETKIKENKVNKTGVSIADAYASVVYNSCKKSFLDFYFDREKTEYYFIAKDGAKLKSLIKKIEFKIKEKSSGQKEKTAEETLRGFELFISSAYSNSDNWIKANFSLSTLDSKFNDIFSTIKNGKQSKSTIAASKSDELDALRDLDRAILNGYKP